MQNSFFSTPSNRAIATGALVMVVVALGMYSYYTWKQSQYLYSGPTTISVTGEAEVNAIPDIGSFSFSVEADGADAKTAQSESAIKMNAVLAFLTEKGIDAKDVKTENYSLYPKYRYESRPCPAGSYCPGEQVEDGFTVSQSVSVKVRAVDTAGDIISGVGEKGATNISGLAFTIDDTTALKDEARDEAIEDAKAKAKVLAEQLGVRLDKMVGYYEEDGSPMPYYGMGGDMMVKNASEAAVAPEMPTGENTTKSRVTLTYQVK
jgi:uncharacterized protein